MEDHGAFYSHPENSKAQRRGIWNSWRKALNSSKWNNLRAWVDETCRVIQYFLRPSRIGLPRLSTNWCLLNSRLSALDAFLLPSLSPPFVQSYFRSLFYEKSKFASYSFTWDQSLTPLCMYSPICSSILYSIKQKRPYFQNPKNWHFLALHYSILYIYLHYRHVFQHF